MLAGNFIGPKVAFLKAPINFPGIYRAQYHSPALSTLLACPREKEKDLGLLYSTHSILLLMELESAMVVFMTKLLYLFKNIAKFNLEFAFFFKGE